MRGVVTALYRRYRPETFAEMIGQSQVTDPLMTALRTDRVNHAYLFSGPRGCGKTTSARILARCLNCAEGPTDVPCGTCPSCVELARGGGGSLDVVEIDAASHNGVDDARDLRERAVFAPARDRYKIFILDEAHMVTPQGFNALLKLVEEPPEHVKFIFATTEPDKVLGTIRSRTHHYPFRLVPPGPMLEYVQQLCTEEGVEVAPGVLPLVVRAGGGSPRDTLSLLDQLIAGSEGTSIDYERAVALLGYTHGALLDEVVDAIGQGDAAGAFAAADRVVQTGQDPRRFVEDLLERLRDLIVVAASTPEAAAAVLRGVSADELARMSTQASAFGAAELSRVADLVNQTLTEMSGATSPRLHLELMLARVLVPAIDDTQRGALARVERLERRVGMADAAGEPAGGAAQAAPSPAAATAPVRSAVQSAPQAPPERPAAERASVAAPVAPAAASAAPTEPAAPAAPAAAPTASAAAAAPKPLGPVTAQQMRDAWPEVLAALQRVKRTAWMAALTAQVIDYRSDDGVLVLGFPSQNDVNDLRGSAGAQSPAELLRAAITEVLGIQVKFIPRVIAAQAPDGQASGGQAPARSADGGDAPQASGASAPGASASGASAPTTSTPTSSGPSAAVPPTSSGAAPASAPASTSRPASTSSPSASAANGGAARDGGRSGPAPATSSKSSKAEAATSAPVDSWATVAIPGDPSAGAASADASAAASGAVHTATLEAERPAASPSAESATSAAPVVAREATQVDAPIAPDDADAPPLDEEPPFDPDFDRAPADEPGGGRPQTPQRPAPSPQPRADAPAEASAAAPQQRRAAPGRSAPNGGIQRYGEAVVREVLGATFLEEVEAPARPGFGERG